jgi:hypothetical protein
VLPEIRSGIRQTPAVVAGSETALGDRDLPTAHLVHAVASSRQRPPDANERTTSPRYEAVSTTYPKPHDRPLPSNDQALLHLPSDLGVSFFEPGANNSPVAHQSQPRLSLVRIDRSILPSERHVRQLIRHFETYTSAAFPIFHIPSLYEWVDQVCFKGEPVESEIACAVLRTSAAIQMSDLLVVLAVSATSSSQDSTQHLRMEAPGECLKQWL